MVLKQPLSHIEKVELRKVWANEAQDFTKWLSEEESLASLGEAMGIDLELIETESSVGSFSADIFAQEIGSGRKVVIENQLEDTNHDHLGKIITYAAGKEAELVVWIVARARDEHKQAIEWLNQHTDIEFGFFLIEIELWKIDGSCPAPRFNIVERPNDWAKAVKASEGYSETERLRLQYWQRYGELAEKDASFRKVMHPQKPSKDHWTTIHIGSSAYHMCLLVYSNEDKIGIEVCVPDNKQIGETVIKEAQRLGTMLDADPLPYNASKSSGIRFFKKGCNFKKHPEKWDEYIQWQLDAAVKLRKEILDLGL